MILNPLIPHWFEIILAQIGEILLRRNIKTPIRETKISLANFSFRITLAREGGDHPARARRAKMTWKTPKIVEVPVGMEINMYACAARK